MFLGELFNEIDNINVKIDRLMSRLEKLVSDVGGDRKREINDGVTELFRMISEKQAKNILINRVLGSVELKVNEARASLQDATEIRKSILERINLLSVLIEKHYDNDSGQTDLSDLFNKRTELYDEGVTLNNIIDSNIWNVRVGEKPKEENKNDAEEAVDQV